MDGDSKALTISLVAMVVIVTLYTVFTL